MDPLQLAILSTLFLIPLSVSDAGSVTHTDQSLGILMMGNTGLAAKEG